MLHEKLLRDPAHLHELMDLLTQSISAELAGHTGEALVLLDRAVTLNPAFVPAAIRRGDLLLGAERYADAIAAYEDCLRYFPQLEEAAQSRHHALLMAVQHAGLLLLDQPDDIDLCCRLAQWQIALGDIDAALVTLEQALALAADAPLVLNLCGVCWLALDRHELALQCYERILARDANDVLALFNRGNVWQAMGVLQQAMRSYAQALALQPDFAEAEVALGYCLLMQGEYAAGWRHHEARWRTGLLQGHGLFPATPAWLGTPALHGRSIVLWAEQGLGDTLQFARYIPAIAAMAQRVTVCVPPPLLTLLATLASANVALVSNDKLLETHDFHCPLMSLPLALQSQLPEIPTQVSYLQADAALVAQWAQRLRPSSVLVSTRLKVGLAWAGRQFGVLNRTRDIALRHLQPLAAMDVELISLQQQIPASDVDELARWPALQCFESAMTDMAQTAALISQLDLVVSADTAVIHLAAALGKPAWLLLRYESEWRWGWGSSSSCWYPSVRIFRQQSHGDWPGLSEEVAACLRAAAAATG